MEQLARCTLVLAAVLLLLIERTVCQSAAAATGDAADGNRFDSTTTETARLQVEPVLPAAGAAAAEAAAAGDPFTRRQTVFVDVGTGKPFPLRFPRLNPLPPGNPATSIRLRVNDTCGILTLLHTVHQPPGVGPPPHLHYAEDEFFISAGTGSTRVFTHQQATKFTPGRLPGFNVPPVLAGSAVMTGTGNGVDKWAGALHMSPAGSVHYFVRETSITDFFTVYLDGFADEDIINYVLYGSPTPAELLLYTGLYGIPTDMTGRFVGYNDSTGLRKDYQQARGPVDLPPAYPQAVRLQGLFDMVEAKRCCKTCLW